MADQTDWYRDQTVFLAGGTGYLGACLLYKLTLQAPTRRVFVLCRKSVQHAIAKLEELMPEQSDEVLDTGKVHFVVGNLDCRDRGMKPADLQCLREQVTVAIQAATEASIIANLLQVVQTNCLASLSLLETICSFPFLRTLLCISSAFVNIFVPDMLIKEETGTSLLSKRFPNPYIFSKYLAERATLDQTDTLPFTLPVVRPSLICPAILHPYPSYGVDKVTLVYSGLQMIASSEYGIERLGRELPPGSYIDELPVDLVANICIVHLAKRTDRSPLIPSFFFFCKKLIPMLVEAAVVHSYRTYRRRRGWSAEWIAMVGRALGYTWVSACPMLRHPAYYLVLRAVGSENHPSLYWTIP
ncbi:male sterility protein-domain-containing protein [Aspergillus lucknowensis]|uniref:Fatty acyl-CoA reductase n=1 Tax=Aspergillus lucknowensis TaxID=176173 RepID=A0ABR4M564_9EURO